MSEVINIQISKKIIEQMDDISKEGYSQNSWIELFKEDSILCTTLEHCSRALRWFLNA